VDFSKPPKSVTRMQLFQLKDGSTLPKKSIWWLLGVAAIALYSVYGWKVHNGQVGADFIWRVTEARYFAAKINPFDVFTGAIPEVPAYGAKAAAYSFSSYYFVNALLKITTNPVTLLYLYSAVDVLALLGGIYLVHKMSCAQTVWPLIFTLSTLLGSIFYWQHVYFLNYTLIATFGLIVLIYGDWKKKNALIIFGLLALSLKPTLAIPAVAYLIVRGRVKALLLCLVLYSAVLALASQRLGESPRELLQQLNLTHQIFSLDKGYIYSEGIFIPLRKLLGINFNIFIIGVCFLILLILRKLLTDPLQAMLIVIALSILLFYNQTHAWIMAYPVLIYAAANFQRKKSYIIAMIILVGFFITPRLLSLFPDDLKIMFATMHNFVRFGSLFVLVLFFITSRQISCPVAALKREDQIA
jgi:hypothetical protein